IPSVGFAIGMERFIQVLGALGKLPLEKKADIFVVSPEPSNFMDNLKIINSLRKEGFSVEYDLACKSIRSQFKMAEKCNAYLALIRGNEEIKQGKIKLKNLSERTEIEINEADLLEKIKLLFKNMNTV
ncbi:MAG: Histidyl-tRNA synthetase, partial [uncultured bacterium]